MGESPPLQLRKIVNAEVVRARDGLRQRGVAIHVQGGRRAGGGHQRPASERRPATSLEDAVAKPVVGQGMPGGSPC